MSTFDSVNKIYDERKEFIILGLTGRTGSGCSTVASILKKDFKELDLRLPKSYDFKGSDERKYSIIYDYASHGDNWIPFYVIEMSDIISSYIFEKGFDEFIGYLNKELLGKKEIEINYESLISKAEELKDEIDSVCKKIKIIDEVLESEHEVVKEEKSDFSKNEIKITRHEYVTLYTKEIPTLSKKIKNILKQYTCKVKYDDLFKESQFYTYLYQLIGNNLRSSGKPYNPEFCSNKFFTIADRTKKLIKNIRKVNNDEDKPTFICIDAIRNQFEASFFKDRYSAFYLISVNTDDNYRRSRLSSKLTQEQIKSLDDTEYPKKLSKNEKFYNQNIGACLEIADIHIYNPDTEDLKYYDLTEQLLKYIILMKHPGLITPTHAERCMQIAYNAKVNSGCLSRQVGAVVTGDDFSIKSVGWNEVPKGQVSCSLRDVRQYCQNKDNESYSNYEITDRKFSDTIHNIDKRIDYSKLGGRKYSYCFKDIYNKLNNKDNQVYTRALHAEENAFLQISKYGGEGVSGGYLFTTASPCELCAKKAYQLGIKRIYYIDPYPGISLNHILCFGSTDNPQMCLFYGAIGNAYISLYTPRMSFKDELKMMVDVNIEEKC